MAAVRKPRKKGGGRSKHIDRIVKLRRLAHGSSNTSERETALSMADRLMRKYGIREEELRVEEKKAAAAGTEEVTMLLERDDATELWQVATAQNIASVHGVVVYERREPFPFVYVLGTAPIRALCHQDLVAVLHVMRGNAVPYSAARYGYLSFLEGMAYGFGVELKRLRDEAVRRRGIMVLRQPDPPPAPPAAPPPAAPPPRAPAPPAQSRAQAQPSAAQAPRIVRPDPQLNPDPMFFQQGVQHGIRLANTYYRLRFDQEIPGRTTQVPLQLSR